MKTEKITEEEIRELKIASLPTRPTAPISNGGAGYSSTEMKAAFDRLPLFIISRFNLLIDDILSDGAEGITSSINSGIRDGHKLLDMLNDITNGAFAEYLSLGDESLSDFKCRILDSMAEIIKRIERLEERTV